MTRVVCSALLLLLPGCGEPERSRFVPATGDAPRAPAAARQGVDKATGEATIPKNIPMH